MKLSVTYDDWKTTEPDYPYDPPSRCEVCDHILQERECDCPCCHEEES